MVTTLNVILAVVSIVLLESILMWIIYVLRYSDMAEIKNEIFRRSKITFRMKMWHAQHIQSLLQRITFYAFIYSCVALFFWGILFLFLMDESVELIGLTWFLGPSFLLWGIIDGYYEQFKMAKDRGVTDEKLRPVVLYLYNESKLGNLKAKYKLDELSHRNDKVGVMIRKLLHELND